MKLDTQHVLNIVENSSEAIIALNSKCVITYWNRGAEILFGYPKGEILNKRWPTESKASLYDLESAIKRAKEGQSTIFKTQKQTKEGLILNLIITTSPIFKNGNFMGISAIVREFNTLKKVRTLGYNLNTFMREPKRTFKQIRKLVLINLNSGKKTINQIANETDINWKTVEKHLTYLIGKKLVNEIFSSEYVRILELTEQGQEEVNRIEKEELKKYIKNES